MCCSMDLKEIHIPSSAPPLTKYEQMLKDYTIYGMELPTQVSAI